MKCKFKKCLYYKQFMNNLYNVDILAGHTFDLHLVENPFFRIQQGRIVHRSGLNNENNKNINKKYKKSKIKDFIFNSTNGKS